MAAFKSDIVLGDGGLGFDSLECMALAAALSAALLLHESDMDDSLVVNTSLHDWRVAVRAALERHTARVCFRSSGSTGRQQSSIHDLVDLDAEILFFAAEVNDRRRIVVTLPCHHIYGFLFSLMLPARLNLPVVDMRNRFPGAVAAALQPGDLIIGHPGFWADLVRAIPDGLPIDIVGVTSGAPCPDAVANAAQVAGLSRLLQVYGSSETAGIGWRDDPGAPYRLLPFWQPVIGGLRLRRQHKNEVEVPDSVDWLDARHFHLKGRLDAAVQVGGLNVYPAKVRDVLREHPAVAEVAVRLMSSTEGSRLKAFIVPQDGAVSHEALLRLLNAYIDARLTVAERPRAFNFGPSLPTAASGKPVDWVITAQTDADRGADACARTDYGSAAEVDGR